MNLCKAWQNGDTAQRQELAFGPYPEGLRFSNETQFSEPQTIGTKSNRDGIGTQIKLTSQSGLVQFNQVTTAGSYASSSDKRVHFGLGRDKLVKEIRLRWPSGTVQTLHNVKADQILRVTEGAM
jgi:ASPIC and UnbV